MLLGDGVVELGSWHSNARVDVGDRGGSAAKRRAGRREGDGVGDGAGYGGMRWCCLEVGKLTMEGAVVAAYDRARGEELDKASRRGEGDTTGVKKRIRRRRIRRR